MIPPPPVLFEVQWMSSLDVLTAPDDATLDRLAGAFSAAPALGIDAVLIDKQRHPLTGANLRKALKANKAPEVSLSRSTRDTDVYVRSLGDRDGLGLAMTIRAPLPSFEGAADGEAGARADALVALLTALAELSPPVYGWAHPDDDVRLGSDPHGENPFAQKKLYEVYWLTVFGASMVKKLGRKKVLATPAHRLVELAGGGVLLLTRPTPGDYLSDAARDAQAAAYCHLDDKAPRAEVRERLAERSARLRPVERRWPPEVEQLYDRVVRWSLPEKRPELTAQLNARPLPPVSEWRPAAEQPPPDVADAAAEIERYEELAESLISGMHKDVPDLIGHEEGSLPGLDFLAWRSNYARRNASQLESHIIPGFGAYLGDMLVRLGGRWSPRRKLDEAAVVIGDRAFLPFLRVRNAMRSQDALLDHSLNQLYREAQRLAAEGRAGS